MKAAAWRQVVRTLLRSAAPVDLGDEATPAGRGWEWLRRYLADRHPADDRETAGELRAPFVENGRVHVFGPDLKRWIRADQYEHLNDHAFGVIMRAAGCEPRRVKVTLEGGRRTTLSAWAVPLTSTTTNPF